MNILRALVVLFHALIIIAGGHGGGPLGIFEVVIVTSLVSGDIGSTVSGSYEERLLTVTLISLFGQSIMTSSYFFDKSLRSRLTILGCLILLIATFILVKDALDIFSIDFFSLVTALPFIGTALVLIAREIRHLRSR